VLKQVKFSTAMRAYAQAVSSGKDEAEVAKLEAAAKAVAPEEVDFDEIKAQVQKYSSASQGTQKAEALFEKYLQAVGTDGDKEKAAALGKQIAALNIKDPKMLNEMAWKILTDEDVKQRDLPLATKLAKAGVDATEGKEAAVLDTYAHALFDSGKIADALEYQKKAVAACEDDNMKSELEDTLKKYQAAADKAK
jgi:hypothetical protein